MKKISMILLISVFTMIGCSNEVKNVDVIPDIFPDVNSLEISENDGTDHYKQLKTITDTERINKVLSVLRTADWENAEVSMARLPDFTINNLYDIWITPKRKQLEIVIMGEGKYIKLPEKESQLLYEIITGKQLGD